MPATAQSAIAVVGIDIGKNSFHIVGLDDRCAIVPAQAGPTTPRSDRRLQQRHARSGGPHVVRAELPPDLLADGVFRGQDPKRSEAAIASPWPPHQNRT